MNVLRQLIFVFYSEICLSFIYFFPPASSFFFPHSLTFTWLIFPHLCLHMASGIADGRTDTEIFLISLFQGRLKTDLKTTRWCRLTQRCSNSSWQPLKLTPRGRFFKRHIKTQTKKLVIVAACKTNPYIKHIVDDMHHEFMWSWVTSRIYLVRSARGYQ